MRNLKKIKNIKMFLMELTSRHSVESIKINDNYLETAECPICFKSIRQDHKGTTGSMVTFLKCDHWACSDCIRRIANLPYERRKCHMCRESFKYYPYLGQVK